MSAKPFFQNTIAMVYDFDGTLSPQPMQEYTVLPKLGIKPKDFWGQVDQESADTVSEKMLVYMRLLLEEAHSRKINISRSDFQAMGKNIEYFPGVQSWFSRINAYVKKKGGGQVGVQHYIISAGMKEILEGISIRRYFQQIYAMTDVPSMALTKKNGGHPLAVYPPRNRRDRDTCIDLLAAKRVDFIAPADYRAESKLSKRVTLLLDSIISGIAYQREVSACHGEHGIDGDLHAT